MTAKVIERILGRKDEITVGKIKEFDIKSGTWSVYVDRLDMYFKVNKIAEELKLPTLIAVMGDEAYELLCNLASPHKPAELKYERAIELLHHHLEPTPSVLAERYRFKQRRQASEENVAAYVAELKKLARHCKFKEGLNENLRDQFVCGLRSDIIRQRLFAEADTISYTDAVRLAISLEAAERDAAAVESNGRGNGGDTTGGEAVHVLGSRDGAFQRASRGARLVRGAARAAGTRHSAASSGRLQAGGRPQAGGRGGANSAGWGSSCTGWGATAHSYSECRFRNYVCSNCRQPGHLRRVCPDRGANTGKDSGTRRSAAYYGEASEQRLPEEERLTEEEFHHLCLSDYRAV
ncbi:uncharacterized protein LOC118270762 [Spodoptera frugiperda]|uniref:Uncharacterized protein LOC118270762 n=1 Tax=Spodoptera frugiperda TaxID=7108 RepID=A0A9R0F5E6_SPOFR|nr:uncharacterized protein LOC118270762 [Spodoptera frugiperda]